MKSLRSIIAVVPVTAALAMGLCSSIAQAQVPSEYTIVASGLNAPRGLKFGPDGALYIAEGGMGGTRSTGSACPQVPGPVGPYTGGSTGTIRKVVNGKLSIVAQGFPSTVTATGDLSSVSDVAFLGGDLYALIAGGGCSHGNPTAPNGIAKVNLTSGQWTMISDLSEYAMTHPGQYDNAGDFEPDGVWFNLIAANGKLLTVEPNRGIIVAVESNGRAQELIDVSASQGHIVPTALASHGEDLYVGNLLYFPILPQWSRILRISKVGSEEGLEIPGMRPTGRYYVSDSKAGLTTVVAVNFGPDGLLYALELSDAAGFPAPGNGKLVRLTRSGKFEDVVTGLNVPGGMTWGPDGRVYISDYSAVPAPHYGAGRVLRFDVAYGY